MAVAFANASESSGDASGGSYSVSPPASLASGDLWVIDIVVDINGSGTGVINLPSGWTAITSTLIVDPGTDNYPMYRSFGKIAGSSESAVSVSLSGDTYANAYAISSRYTGAHATSWLGSVATANPTGEQADYNAPDVSVSADGSVGVTVLAAQNCAITAVPSGTTLIHSQTDAFPTMAAAYQTQDTGTWTPATWTQSPDELAAASYVLLPAGGGGGGTPPSSRLSLLGVG